jgi:hypothetical protein
MQFVCEECTVVTMPIHADGVESDPIVGVRKQFSGFTLGLEKRFIGMRFVQGVQVHGVRPGLTA